MRFTRCPCDGDILPVIDDWLEWCVVDMLAIWFASIVAYQFFKRQMTPLVRRFDPFNLLFLWRLFSWTPRDVRLWYRDRTSDGICEPWHEIPSLRSPRWYRVVWNPEELKACALFWLKELFVRSLIPGMTSEQLERRQITRTLWQVVMSQPPFACGTHRQFEVRTFLLTEPSVERVLHTSEFQALGESRIP